MPDAQDEAIVLLAAQRGMLEPESISRARQECQRTGARMAAVLAGSLGREPVERLIAELGQGAFRCPARNCRVVRFAELAGQPRLRCPVCGGHLVRAPAFGSDSEVRGRRGSDRLDLSPPSEASSWGRSRTIGRYKLIEELGRGAMGVVFLAKREGLDRKFALKVLLDGEDDEEALARFKLEGEVAAKLEHPGILGVFDVGRQGRFNYLVMEYGQGQTLKRRLRDGAMAPRAAARIVLELAKSVAYAHGQGVIHRDLKPANIIMDERSDRPRITDFGLAKDRSLNRSLTKTGDILGSPVYMSPEQCEGDKSIDARTDVYSLGVILYECLTGQLPYMANDFLTVFRLVVAGTPTPPREHDPKIPELLEAICLQAMRSDRETRTPDASALAAQLEAFLLLKEPKPATEVPQAWIVAGIVAVFAVVGLFVVGIIASSPSARDDVVETPPGPTPPLPPETAPQTAPETSPETAPETAPETGLDLPRPVIAPTAEDEVRLRELARCTVYPGHRAKPPEMEVYFKAFETDAPALVERYPNDSRAVYMGVFLRLVQRTGHDLKLRRELLRAMRLQPVLPDECQGLIATLLHVLGFQRAAGDLLEPKFGGGSTPSAFVALSLLHVKMKSSPPVFDVRGATRICREALKLRLERAPGRLGDDLLVPTWDLCANLGALYVAQGQMTQGAVMFRQAAEVTRSERLRRGFLKQAYRIEQGKVPPEDALRNITFVLSATEFTGLSSSLQEIEDQRSVSEAARSAEVHADRMLGRSEKGKAALLLVRAGRALFRLQQAKAALSPLRRAASLDLTSSDADVRALVCRFLGRLLVWSDRPPAAHVTEALALAKSAIQAQEARPLWFTRGERAEAWVLLGRCELLAGRSAAAREAVAKAEAEEPYDRRELEALQGRLQR